MLQRVFRKFYFIFLKSERNVTDLLGIFNKRKKYLQCKSGVLDFMFYSTFGGVYTRNGEQKICLLGVLQARDSMKVKEV